MTRTDDISIKDAAELLSVVFDGIDESEERIYIGTQKVWCPDALVNGRYATRGRAPMYFCASSVMPAPEGEDLMRTNDRLMYMYCFVLDDIGTKYDEPELDPTAIVETSKGNEQWIYALDEPLPMDEANDLLARIKGADIGDIGALTVGRLIKLPGSIRGKDNDPFRALLLSLEPDNIYDVDQLIKGLGLGAAVGRRSRAVARSPQLPADDYRKVVDPVLAWLGDRGEVYGDAKGGFVDIRCPWCAAHTDGVDVAGYSPIGAGAMVDTRAFHCFHEHCAEYKTVDFLEWVAEQGGPRVPVFDPVQPLVSRYVLLEYSNEVADTWAPASAAYPIVSLSSFRNAHRQYIEGVRGGKQYYGDMWLEHSETVRCKGRVYDPGSGPIIEGDNDDLLFNTYRPISHPQVLGEPRVYLDHIEWLLPDEGERDLFHKWVAQKLQKPASRSYALVMVASLMHGENGQRYGTGRSTVGDILGKVFQSGVAKVSLEDITGRGDSQSAFNDWADSSQLVITEETKEEASDWRTDHALYERLKTVIDTRPIPGVRVKPKYGKIYETTVYCNFLFFTNHHDALQLPADDRRVAVLTNAKGRRSFEEYAALNALLQDPDEIARIYWWYMRLDVSDFDHIYPPMTPAKAQMAADSDTDMDVLFRDALESMEGRLCTVNQLVNAAMALDESDFAGHIAKVMRAKFRTLAEVVPGHRVNVEGKNVRPRIIRDIESVRQSYITGDYAVIREDISRNSRFGL